MLYAKFKHVKTGGVYTVAAKVTASLLHPAQDMDIVGIRAVDLGHIAVTLPNLRVLHKATVQGLIENGEDCVLYKGEDGEHWLRVTREFTDGRFEPLDARAACMMPPQWHFSKMGTGA